VITMIERWLQMRFGTRLLLVVGLLAVLDRLAATTTTAGRYRGWSTTGGPPARADRSRASGVLIGKDVR
jgi:hypothetical protein